MTRPVLVIGNKAYSSWSLRPWLLMRHTGIEFDEVRLPFRSDAWRDRIGSFSPSGKVPVLVDGAVSIWESLAICEYLAEMHPSRGLWPNDPAARAVARSVSAEMHSGFQSLRAQLPMNVRRAVNPKSLAPEVAAEVSRIKTMWAGCRTRFGASGEFLFGEFSIADAMYAPVVTRFFTYAVALEDEAARYAEAVFSLPALREWIAQANTETEVIAEYER